MLDLIMKLMEEAEGKFDNGTTRKEWVLAMIKASSDSINYDTDMEKVSALIDSLCAMAKVVNYKEKGNDEGLSINFTKKVGD